MSEFTGIYQGIVVERIDPEGKGRVRVQVPQALGTAPSNWADPSRPTKSAPAIGETVHVQFLNGDPTKPVYIADPVVKQEQIDDGVQIEPIPGEPGQVENLKVTPGIQMLFLTWDAVENDNPVEYIIRASTTDIDVESTVEIGRVSGTMHPLRTALHSDEPGPELLRYGVDYNICVQAVDIYSNEAVGSVSEVVGPTRILQVTGEDIAVASVVAENIAAESITAEHFAAILVISSVFKTAETGRRVEIGPAGVQLYESDGSLLVDLSTADDTASTFYGEVIAQTFRAIGGATFEGESTIAPSSQLILSNKVGPPLTAPGINFAWDSVAANKTSSQAGLLGTFAFVPSRARSLVVIPSAFVVSTEETGGTRVWYFNKTTGAVISIRDLQYLYQAHLSRASGTVEHAGEVAIVGRYAPPARTNMIMNASFESGTTDFVTPTNATVSVATSSSALVGTQALIITPTGTSDIEVTFPGPDAGGRHAVTPSSIHSFSLYSNTPAFTGFLSESHTYSPLYQTGIQWFTSGGAPISTSLGSAIRVTSGLPVRVTVEATSPSNAAYGLPILKITGVNLFVNSEATHVDCVLFERGTLGDYFDGDNFLRYHQDWEGTPNNSQSIIVVDGVEYRRNLFPDPSMESDAAWSKTGVLTTVVPGSGIVANSGGIRVSPDPGWTPDAFPRRIGFTFDTDIGDTYTASMYVKRETPTEADNCTILINGAATGTNTAVSVADEVKRLFVTFTATDVSHTLSFWFSDYDTGETVLLTNPMIEKSGTRNYYFDGDTTV